MAVLGAGGVLVGITTALLLMTRTHTPSPRTHPASASTPSDAHPVVETESAPTWVGRRKAIWASDGSKSIVFELAALNDVAVWMTRTRPRLVVRCLGGSTEVFVVIDGAASIEGQTGRHTVRLQIDEDGPSEQQWSDSESSQELFAPDGITLAQRLAHARTLRFGFTPYNARPVVADFNVKGFDELVGLVASTCRWPSTTWTH